MRPLIFEFKENPTGQVQDYSLIEYDENLSLSVNKLTGQPAVDSINLETETFTKTQGESSDSDRDAVSILMDTATMTLVHSEASDDDKGKSIFQNLVDTAILAESTESVVQDNSNHGTNNYSQN